MVEGTIGYIGFLINYLFVVIPIDSRKFSHTFLIGI